MHFALANCTQVQRQIAEYRNERFTEAGETNFREIFVTLLGTRYIPRREILLKSQRNYAIPKLVLGRFESSPIGVEWYFCKLTAFIFFLGKRYGCFFIFSLNKRYTEDSYQFLRDSPVYRLVEGNNFQFARAGYV